MAKVPFTKLKCKINEDFKPVQIGEETIAVKQYLPIQEKLGLISRVIMQSHEQDANYSNPVKSEVYTELEMLFAYTNISFTEKQKEDLPKLYDMLKSSGIIDEIIKNIPEVEINAIFSGVWRSVESIYNYQNSILGIISNIKNNYDNTEFDIENMQQAVQDLAKSPLIQDILPLLDLNS